MNTLKMNFLKGTSMVYAKRRKMIKHEDTMSYHRDEMLMTREEG